MKIKTRIKEENVITTDIVALDFGDLPLDVFENLSSEALLFNGRVRMETHAYTELPMNWLTKLFGKNRFSRTYDRAKFEFNNPKNAEKFIKHAALLYPTIDKEVSNG